MSLSPGNSKSRHTDDYLGLAESVVVENQDDEMPTRGSKPSLGMYLQSEYGKFTRPPPDILPPPPKLQRDSIRNVPFLFTRLAKDAFSPSELSRPNSADFRRRRRTPHTIQTDHVSGTRNQSPMRWGRSSKKDDASLEINTGLEIIPSSRLGSGRTSAPPMMMSINDSFLSLIEPTNSASMAGIRDSMEQLSFRTRKRIKKKTPDLFILEAEQRAIEGEQKAIEREDFHRKRSELEVYLTKLAGQYNELKKTRQDLEKQYTSLQEQKAEVVVVEEELKKVTSDSQKLQQLQDLEAKLDYWTQTLREEESYTKTLQHMQIRSASDKHKRELETADLLKVLQNHDHDLSALAMRLLSAKNERAVAERRVLDYLSEIELYRERRDARLHQRKREVHQLQLKDAALRRLIAEEEALNASKNAINQAASQAALAAQRQKEAFHSALDEGFGRIMSVTGVRTVEELADSFIRREERTGQLQAVLDAIKTRIDELTTARQDLGRQLLRIKFSGGGGGLGSSGGAESDAADAALRNLARVRRRAAERRGKLAGLEALLIRVRAGLEHLASKFTEDLRIDPDSDGPPSLRAVEPVERMAAAHPAAFGDASSVSSQAGAADEADGDRGGPDDGGAPRSTRRARGGAGRGAGAAAQRLLDACADRLERAVRFLEVHTQGVPPQRLEDARTVSATGGAAPLLGLDAAPHNARVPLESDRGGGAASGGSGSAAAAAREAAAARAEWAEDGGAGAGEEPEDRPGIKARADRLVARRRRELAARFDEYGNEIQPAPAHAAPAPGPAAPAAAGSLAVSPARGGAADKRRP